MSFTSRTRRNGDRTETSYCNSPSSAAVTGGKRGSRDAAYAAINWDELRPATREETLPVVMAAILLGFMALMVCFAHGYLLLYGDADAHLGIARRILDSRNPGLVQ